MNSVSLRLYVRDLHKLVGYADSPIYVRRFLLCDTESHPLPPFSKKESLFERNDAKEDLVF